MTCGGGKKEREMSEGVRNGAGVKSRAEGLAGSGNTGRFPASRARGVRMKVGRGGKRNPPKTIKNQKRGMGKTAIGEDSLPKGELISGDVVNKKVGGGKGVEGGGGGRGKGRLQKGMGQGIRTLLKGGVSLFQTIVGVVKREQER